MNRTGLIIALAIAIINGVVFALFPELELAIARRFYEVVDASNNTFALRIYPPLMLARDIGLWIGTLLVSTAVAALIVKLVFPKRKLLMPGRAIVFLIATMALGPGLLVNVVLKEHWGRPRPIDVTQFNGADQYMPWWKTGGSCQSNCSFVSGDVSGAFWTMAPAALAPPQYRVLAYGAALTLGTAMGAARVVQGGHFVSDVVFAGAFTFLIIWLVYAMIYRWPRTRLSDDRIEAWLERISLFGRKKKP